MRRQHPSQAMCQFLLTATLVRLFQPPSSPKGHLFTHIFTVMWSAYSSTSTSSSVAIDFFSAKGAGEQVSARSHTACSLRAVVPFCSAGLRADRSTWQCMNRDISVVWDVRLLFGGDERSGCSPRPDLESFLQNAPRFCAVSRGPPKRIAHTQAHTGTCEIFLRIANFALDMGGDMVPNNRAHIVF